MIAPTSAAVSFLTLDRFVAVPVRRGGGRVPSARRPAR
jgi:hypothetical protein